MQEFLNKEVQAFGEEKIKNILGDSIPADKRDEIFISLVGDMLKKNNEFAIKEVFDDETFEENSQVVKEVVNLLASYQIRYPRKQQHLSDFFELLLTTGLKQESGQYFTPVPIARFICKSVPLAQKTHQKLRKGITNDLLPNIIDYAAGSGHFLTESMEEVQKSIDNFDENSIFGSAKNSLSSYKADKFAWAMNHMYGVEKDYRLVKVSKVGCYFYGDGLASVIHGDGLDSFKNSKTYLGALKKYDSDNHSQNNQFDFVLSNPPYSVSGFIQDIKNKEKAKKNFDLYTYTTDQSSEIEALFIERTSQLLTEDGITALILPASILSNSGIYTKARELMLKNFEIISIVELGNNTFMATGTSTVTLFLRKRKSGDWKDIQEKISGFFHDQKDKTVNGVEHVFSKYVSHVFEDTEISFADYQSLIAGYPNETIKNSEFFKEYAKKLSSKIYKTDAQKLEKILEIEKDKLLYFILAHPQEVVLVNSGQKKEEKQFLGYEFSHRRGDEGLHAINRSKTVDECTKLYDDTDFYNPEKASTYILEAFEGKPAREIDESLKKNISRVDLIDMLTFDRTEFEKTVSTSVKKKIKIESKWELEKIEKICPLIESGNRPKGGVGSISEGILSLGGEHIQHKKGGLELEIKKYVSIGFFEKATRGKIKTNDIFLCKDGALSGKIAIERGELNNQKAMVNEHVFLMRCDNSITQFYLFNYLFGKTGQALLNQSVTGTAQGGINSTNLKEIKIPLPPLDIQQKIVDECEAVDSAVKNAEESIEKGRSEIEEMVRNIEGKKVFLGDIAVNLSNKRVPVAKVDRVAGKIPYYGASGIVDYVSKYLLDDYLLLISEDGENLRSRNNAIAFTASGKMWVNNHAHILKFEHKTTHKIVEYYLNKLDISEFITGQAQPKLNQGNLNRIKIPLPPLETQQKIVAEIETIEAQIAEHQKIIDEAAQKKEEILKKYL